MERGDRFCIGAAVVNLTGAGNCSRDFEWSATGPRTYLQVMERNVGRESAATTLAGIAAATFGKMVLPLVPLMTGGGEKGNIEEWARLASAELDPRRNSVYGALARVFAAGADSAAEWISVLKEWNVTRSPVVEEWRAEGRVDGQVATIIGLLEDKFQVVPPNLAVSLRSIVDPKRLLRMAILASRSVSLDQFRADAGL